MCATYLGGTLIAHFQKTCQTGARIGARSIMGSLGEGGGDTIARTNIFFAEASLSLLLCVSEKILALAIVPPNDPIIEHMPTVAPVWHSFWKWAIGGSAFSMVKPVQTWAAFPLV